MSAFKEITIFRPRKNVVAKFRSLDGINLPQQTVLFANLSLFREYARRISATTAGKLDYSIAEYAVDNELPKPSYNNKEIRFHNALRSALLKKREDFIKNKQATREAPSNLSATTLDEASEFYFKYVSIELTNIKSLRTYKISQTKALDLLITHDSGFTKRLGDYRFEELEFKFDGTGFKIIAALRSLVQKGNTAESSLYLIQQQIKRFFKYLQLKEYTSSVPLYPKVPQPKPESVPFTDEELEKFEDHARELYESGENKNFLRGFYLARFTGARVHEIAHLQIKHWHKTSPVNSTFILPRAKGFKKSERGAGVATLFASNDTLISFLEKDFEGRDPEEYILAKPNGLPWFVHGSSYTNVFSKKLNILGIFGKQPWHAFRHTGAIELFEITSDIYIVKSFLRHELIETTKRYLNSTRVNHVVEKNQNFLGKKTVRTLRNQNPQLKGGNKLIELNPIREVA